MNVKFNEDTPQFEKMKKIRQRAEERMVKTFAKKYGLKYINLIGRTINTDALKLIPEERARKANMAAYDIKDKKIFIAMRSPLPKLVQDEIASLKRKGFEVETLLTSMKSLEKA